MAANIVRGGLPKQVKLGPDMPRPWCIHERRKCPMDRAHPYLVKNMTIKHARTHDSLACHTSFSVVGRTNVSDRHQEEHGACQRYKLHPPELVKLNRGDSKRVVGIVITTKGGNIYRDFYSHLSPNASHVPGKSDILKALIHSLDPTREPTRYISENKLYSLRGTLKRH